MIWAHCSHGEEKPLLGGDRRRHLRFPSLVRRRGAAPWSWAVGKGDWALDRESGRTSCCPALSLTVVSWSFFVLDGDVLGFSSGLSNSTSTVPSCDSANFSRTSSDSAVLWSRTCLSIRGKALHVNLREELAVTFKDPGTKVDFSPRLLRPVWPSGVLDQAVCLSLSSCGWVFQAEWSFASGPLLIYLRLVPFRPVGRGALPFSSRCGFPSCISHCACLLGGGFWCSHIGLHSLSF